MYKAKLILVGEGEVGKTSIIQQFIEQRFNPSYLITIGSDKSMKDLNINGKDIKLEIWDTAGQGKYRKVNKIFMKNTKIALLVYDITDKKTFEQLNYWINHVKDVNKNENIIFGIAANKSDLFEQQVVSTEEGKKFADENNCLFFETSAKDYKSIENTFTKLTESYLENIHNKKIDNDNNNNNNNDNENSNNNNYNNSNKNNNNNIIEMEIPDYNSKNSKNQSKENEIDEQLIDRDKVYDSSKCSII